MADEAATSPEVNTEAAAAVPVDVPAVDTAVVEPVVETTVAAEPAIADPVVAAEPALAEPAPAVEVVAEPAAAPKPRRGRKPKPKVEATPVKAVPAAAAKPVRAVKAVRKPAVRTVAKVKPAPKAAAPKPVLDNEKSKTHSVTQLKDKIMAIKKPTDFTATLSGFAAEAQDKAKSAYEKSTVAMADASEFAKGNVEALVESGKILAEGLKDMGSTLVEEGKTAFETLSADVKEFTGAKTPADFFKLQSEMLRRSFESAVAFSSKNTEAMMKLAGDAAAPLSGRVNAAIETAKKAA